MRDPLDLYLFKQGEYRLDIDLSRGEQGLAHALAAESLNRRFNIGVLYVKDLMNKRKTVRMDAGGRQRNDRVSDRHLLVIDDLIFIDHTGAVTGEVVFVLGIEAGHLSGLTADRKSVV